MTVEHGIFIMATGKGVWAECECGWEGPVCDSPAQAAVVWSEHLQADAITEDAR